MAAKATWDAVWAAGGPVTAVELRQEVDLEAGSSRCREILGYLRAQGLSVAGLRAVEVGCGSAIYGSILAQRGASVTLLDQSASALERAKARAEALGVMVECIQADAFRFAEENCGAFDLAMSFGTVEHFRPPSRLELCRAHANLVRPGGVVVVSVPNQLFLPHEILKRLLILRGKWFLGYEGSFTPWELRTVARNLGLQGPVFHGTDVVHDAHRYWKIVAGTRLWGRIFPWWKSRNSGAVSTKLQSGPHRPTTQSINRLLGLDITLLGVKGL
jgi:2-polyprenyl-3-methyl-5-hydroxy-6-metoxy-1,4-benzoquinol methylase